MTLVTFRQMVAAELLRLRRKRSIMTMGALFTVVVVVIYFGVLALQHAASPAIHGPAGGLANYDHATVLLSVFFGALAAILVGTEAGTSDLASGVFRDLVVTGRSRLWLFVVRVPAALIVTLAFGLTALAISLAAAYGFAGGQPTPGATYVLDSILWVCLAQALLCVVAVGLGSLTGSRATSLTVLIGWDVIAGRLLARIASLGSPRDLIPNVALGGLKPGQLLPDSNGIVPGVAAAVVVIVAWIAVALCVGAWQTRVRDA